MDEPGKFPADAGEMKAEAVIADHCDHVEQHASGSELGERQHAAHDTRWPASPASDVRVGQYEGAPHIYLRLMDMGRPR